MDKKLLYTQAQENLRATDEMSFKLIGLVPLGTLLAFIGTFFKEIKEWNDWFYLIGVFGSLVVFGIYRWELRNIQNCYKYCDIIEALDLESTIKDVGKYQKPQFFNKMNVGKTQSEKLIYSVLIISWLVLPFMLRASTTNSSTGVVLLVCYLVFCVLMIAALADSAFRKIKCLVEKKQTESSAKQGK